METHPRLLVRLPGDTEDLEVAWRAGAWQPRPGDTVEIVRIGGAWGVRDRWIRAAPAPRAPFLVSATGAVRAIVLTWTAPPSGTEPDGYVVWQRLSGTVTWAVALRTFGVAMSITLPGLAGDQRFDVQVSAFSVEYGESERSNVRSAETLV